MNHTFRLPFFLLWFSFLAAGTVAAQSPLPGQSVSKNALAQKDEPGVMDVLSSIGRMVTGTLRDTMGVDTSEEQDWDSNDSPRHTLFTFINGMDAILRKGSTEYERVNQTLPDGFTHDSPEVLALKGVLDRLAPLSPVYFPDTSTSAKSTIRDFEVFPYAVDHQWVWERLGQAPEGEIHLIYETESERWIFSRETLEQAPALLDSMRALPPVYPSQAHEDLLKSVFQPMVDKSPWWGWVILGLSLVGGFMLGNLVKRLFVRAGDRLEAHTRPVVGVIIRSIGTSMGILSGTMLFIFGGSFVHFSQIFSNIYWEIIQGILLIAVLWAILGVTNLVSALVKNRVMQDNDEYGAMTVTIVHRVVNTLLYTFLAVFLLENVFSLNIGALITGLGIIGLAVSLAGKESAQNLFGAITIFTNRPFVVGDWITIKGNLGEVKDVGMQATYLRLISGEMLIVPNMQFVSNEVQNLSMRRFLRRDFDIALPYGTPPEMVTKAIEILKGLLTRDDLAKEGRFNLEERPASVTFSRFGDYYLNLKVYYWYFIGETGVEMQRNHERGWFTYLEHCSLVNQAILESFNEHGIEFAFPTQTLELARKKVSET
ncbi:MAG: mechanosensitive ion channel [Verrucomicrobia bacterium]|nr:mechanosensitive ion channel [Verrucomicrobiota bacterium]